MDQYIETMIAKYDDDWPELMLSHDICEMTEKAIHQYHQLLAEEEYAKEAYWENYWHQIKKQEEDEKRFQ